MTFTRKDIADNKQLVSFLRTRITPCRMGQSKTSFHPVAIYETKVIIAELEDRITKYKKGSYARFIPTWEKFVVYLKEMENDK